MEEEYRFSEVEQKWNKFWQEQGFYRAEDFSSKPKFYILVMFPYPSGSGLHVGHCRNYIPADVVARFKRMQGFNVLHPIGYDAFGLPAENYAIEKGIHPKITTEENIKTFRRQLKMLGLSYDWDREFSTADPEYYKWTEWLFELMHKRGLAHQNRSFQWWCPHCKTVLANEQIEDGKCWRCGTHVEKKELNEWFFRITDYADRLLEGLETIDWPERIKLMQKNWVGKSKGAEINFKGVAPDGSTYDIPVFTTRIDTIYGVTFLVIAPEHPLIDKLTAEEKKTQVSKYVEEALRKFEIDRLAVEREKTGEFLGTYAVNPFNNEKVPIFVGDYVVYSYGTGAVMGVPAHDERDFAFAKKHGLEIRQVISKDGTNYELKEAYVEEGILINSQEFSGLESRLALEKLTEFVEKNKIGRGITRYRMRDWLISRQRYWGAPIPVIHCPEHGAVLVPEEELPVLLPDEVDFSPRDTGESPLANDREFYETKCPICGKPARRETDTQDGFACSSWYFLRYADPRNNMAPFDREKAKYWLPVDLYIGGAEHAVMHLLYARFYTKVMHDEGLVGFDEPFTKLLNQGMILGLDHQKMSKSRGNVVNPDDVVGEFGADTLRAYILFMGPLDSDAAWSIEGINGISRFIRRVWNLFNDAYKEKTDLSLEIEKDIEIMTDKMIVRITRQAETYRFNTMVSSFMEWLNYLSKIVQDNISVMRTRAFRDALNMFVKMLAPAAPYLAEELWQRSGNRTSVHLENWPKPKGLFKEETALIIVQVDGKLRDRVEVPLDAEESEVVEIVKKSDKISKLNIDFLKAKFVFVKNRLLNIVTI